MVLIALYRPVSATDIWFGAARQFVSHLGSPDGVSDFMELFEPGAPWQNAAGDVRVFATSSQWLTHGPDDDLRRMFVELKRRHIVLSVAGLMLGGIAGCGRGVEGYEGPDYMARIAARVQRLGGSLDYVEMDEPLWFGHDYQGPQACRSSVEQVAQDVARKVHDIQRVFPAVQVGDAEPVAGMDAPGWIDELLTWAAAYRAAVGQPLAFVHADVQWIAPWQEQLALLATTAKRLVAGAPVDIGQSGEQKKARGRCPP